MKPFTALLFAIVGTLFLVGVGASLSYRSALGAIVCFVAFIGWTGYGFAVKARQRRKRDS